MTRATVPVDLALKLRCAFARRTIADAKKIATDVHEGAASATNKDLDNAGKTEFQDVAISRRQAEDDCCCSCFFFADADATWLVVCLSICWSLGTIRLSALPAHDSVSSRPVLAVQVSLPGERYRSEVAWTPRVADGTGLRLCCYSAIGKLTLKNMFHGKVYVLRGLNLRQVASSLFTGLSDTRVSQTLLRK